MAVAGVALAIRATAGPGLMHSPLNAEGWFGVLLILALLMRSRTRGQTELSTRRLTAPWDSFVCPLALVALVAIAFGRAMQFYLLSDDFILLILSNSPHWSALQMFTTAGGDGFFRPVGNLSLTATAAWAGYDPQLWHLVALVLHAANCVLVLLLAGRWCESRWAAWFAAALFAIHGTRPEAAVWLAGRFDLLATFFVLAGMLLVWYGQDGAALVAMTLALLSKESAYAFPFLVALHIVVRREKLRRLIPFFGVAAQVFAYRWALFGGIGGYGGTLEFLPALKALAMRIWANLFFPINWSVEPGGVAVVALIAGLALLARAQVDRRKFLFALGWVMLTALPPLQQLLIGADLQKSRLLYLPSVGFCFMLGVALDGLRAGQSENGGQTELSTRRLTAPWDSYVCPLVLRIPLLSWVAPVLVLLGSLAVLEHNLNAWDYASQKARAACQAAVKCAGEQVGVQGLPGSLRGVYFFANGLPACLEMNLKRVPAIGTGPPLLVWDSVKDELQCVP